MMKRIKISLIGMFFYALVAYSGNILTGLAKLSSWRSILIETCFFGIFILLFQQFRKTKESDDDYK
ncbi:hypothetical protein [Vagococcus intermedius]|uniref:Uncharacterized protein n=1 Tax=Vagococcus intermedius TaxID=2991418 RepID=A0AAF0CT55_9ENTE|nr:hypothetical protein [Vagococcus intermedius]WEG72426.1 hypothetical protein OL234_05420 [Vagococcus intermedius]WEG74513.1 hypothetical protein OL235_05425 [Vagococcus intermedius]